MTDQPAPTRNPLSPKKLLLSKWTAVTPRHKERHFIVTRVVLPEPPATRFYSTLPGTTPGLTRPRPRPPEHDRRPRPRCPPPGGLFRFFLKGTSCVCRISRYGLD